MIDMSTRRKRLERLVELAQVYRNWSRRELSETLGRDASKLVPASGNPKLDLIVELADVLDWTVGDVTDCLWNTGASDVTPIPDDGTVTFEEIDRQAGEAHRAGRYRQLIQLAARARELAETSDERAIACNREFGGWDGLGRFSRSLEVAREGLHEASAHSDVRRMLQSNLANAYYSLWHLMEAQAIASDLINRYEESPPVTHRDRRTYAFSLYVLGNTHRRLIDAEPSNAHRHAAEARTALLDAIDRFSAIPTINGETFEGIARTCRGGILESDVMLGKLDARQATSTMIDAMSEVVDLSKITSGDLLESHGWWCIFGCNVAMRHLSDDRELHRMLAMLTNKADEIANRLDNWAMRERVFSIQFDQHRRFAGWTGQSTPLTIDSEDIRMITGTMGRFPQFRRTGWKMLESASVVTDDIVTAQ